MRQRATWQLVGIAGLFLLVPALSRAAVQGKDGVYWLGTGDWQLRENAGEVHLVQCPLPRDERLAKESRCKWIVSVPTIKAAESGNFLASDPDGRNPTVHLVGDKGANTKWVFEIVDRLSPGYSKEERHLKEGPEGFTFRVKLADGPFKDWYLAVEGPEEGKAKSPLVRRLKLVRGVKEATVLKYVEVNYFVNHL
jgi:hypothetical protein